MNLTEDQLFDYIGCPAFYDMKYNMQIPIEEAVSLSKMLNKLKKNFFALSMNGTPPGTATMKKSWDTICNNNYSEVTGKIALDGLRLIQQLLNWSEREDFNLADINVNYDLIFTRDKEIVELSCSIDTILLTPTLDYELLTVDFGNKQPDQTRLDFKLKHTLDNYAVLTASNKNAWARVHNVKNNTDFYTYRTSHDYSRLKETVLNVGKSIEQGLFYPREGIMCDTCTAKQYCKAWGC